MPRGKPRPLEELNRGELNEKRDQVEQDIRDLRQELERASADCALERRRISERRLIGETKPSYEELNALRKIYDRIKRKLQAKRLVLSTIIARQKVLRQRAKERRHNGET